MKTEPNKWCADDAKERMRKHERKRTNAIPIQIRIKIEMKEKIGDIETWYYKCAVDVNINYQKERKKSENEIFMHEISKKWRPLNCISRYNDSIRIPYTYLCTEPNRIILMNNQTREKIWISIVWKSGKENWPKAENKNVHAHTNAIIRLKKEIYRFYLC